MSLIIQNKCSDQNCVVKDKNTNKFVVSKNAPPNSECCREINSNGQQSNRGLWCAKGSCDHKTGLCSKQTEIKCMKDIKENYSDSDGVNYNKVILLIVLFGCLIIGLVMIILGLK